MTLSDKQKDMIGRINALGDCFDQYSYLLVKAQELPEMTSLMRSDEALVPGCQSQVWLYVWTENDRLYFDADSDTLILRGVLMLLKDLLYGEKLSEVRSLDVRLFSETELTATFTSDRNTGVRSILRLIRDACQKGEAR